MSDLPFLVSLFSVVLSTVAVTLSVKKFITKLNEISNPCR